MTSTSHVNCRSELRGMSKVKVHVHYETLTTSVEITVWFPRLPTTVWISDPVLNAIKGFLVYILFTGTAAMEGILIKWQHFQALPKNQVS